MGATLSTKQKQEWAELLYRQGDMLQKDIAAKVGVSAKTMSKWVNDGHWEDYRKSMLTTKNEILRNLYSLLDKINKKLKEDDSVGDSKTADMYVKYTAAINNLETETSVGELMEAGRMFHSFLQKIDPVFALQVLEHYDAFIKDNLKKFK